MTDPEPKHIGNMTRKEFLAVPSRANWRETVECDSIVLIPTRQKHESGYRKIIAVACKGGYPLCRVTSVSDRLDLVGYDYLTTDRMAPLKSVVESWRIDCLPKSNLFNIWTRRTLRVGADGSSIDIEGFPQENR